MRGHLLIGVRLGATVLLGVLVLPTGAALGVTATVSFQNGANGYSGALDRRISSGNEISNGADSAAYFLDGFNGTDSNDTQGLIRFNDILGSGAGQIPSGATILDARLTVTTSLAGNAQTSGPFGVAGLLRAVDSNTDYFANFNSSTDFTSRGAWWQDNSATRPVGGYGFQIPGAQDSANVTPIVQAWASGAPAHGFVIQAGLSDTITNADWSTADGWSIHTTGFPTSDTRPKLEVTYTTEPMQIRTFQRGADGYGADTMAIVRGGDNALNADPPSEITEDASTLNQTFLDGVFFTNTAGDTIPRGPGSPDDFALLKFADVFGNGPGQVPADIPVAKAWAVVTTGDSNVNSRSSGPWSAHTVLRSWDTTSLHSSFGAVNGLQVGDGDISPGLDAEDGMIRGAEVWFDVTSYVEGVRNGATDHGIAILTNGTTDGWQIHTNGSTDSLARPRLVVYAGNVAAAIGLNGDYNNNGIVDTADYVVWRENLNQSVPLPNDTTPGNVTQADYDVWRANFGRFSEIGGLVGTGAAVPEPGSCLLGLVAVATLGLTRRKRLSITMLSRIA
jgi:hypothetical protein